MSSDVPTSPSPDPDSRERATDPQQRASPAAPSKHKTWQQVFLAALVVGALLVFAGQLAVIGHRQQWLATSQLPYLGSLLAAVPVFIVIHDLFYLSAIKAHALRPVDFQLTASYYIIRKFSRSSVKRTPRVPGSTKGSFPGRRYFSVIACRYCF